MRRSSLCLLIVLLGGACLNSGVLAQPTTSSPAPGANIEITRALQEFVNEMRALQTTLRHSIALAQRAQMIEMQISLQEDRIERLTQHIATRRRERFGSWAIGEMAGEVEDLENMLKEPLEPAERTRLMARLEIEKKRKQLRDEAAARLETDIQRVENKRQQEQDRLSELQREAVAVQKELNDYLRETQHKP